MSTEIPKNIKRRFIALGFRKTRSTQMWGANFVVSENKVIYVDCFGTVYLHEGFTRQNGHYYPKCINSFMADTPSKIEVLVKPLLDK